MKIILQGLLLLLPAFTLAQKVNDQLPVFENAGNHFIKADGEGYYLSGDLTNEFTDKFFKGGYIDSTLKKNILAELKDENRAGAEISFGLSWYGTGTQFIGRPHWGWTAGISNHENFGLSFQKNLFELVFFGNGNFIGDTVQLAPMQVLQTRFQKIRLGAFHKENFSSVTIGFIKAESFLEVEIEDARLYTESNSLELNLALSEKLNRSDTGRMGIGAFNGWGLCTDLIFNLNGGEKKSIRFSDPIRISLENFGFVQWNNKTIQRENDTSFHYEGFEVTDLLNGGDSPFTNTNPEDTISLVGKKETLLRLLPFTFSVTKLTNERSNAKWQSFYGFRLKARSLYKPMIFAGLQFRPVKHFTSSMYAAFGGYGGFRAGLQFTGMMADRIFLTGGTGNITGWFLPGAYGKDLSVGILVKL